MARVFRHAKRMLALSYSAECRDSGITSGIAPNARTFAISGGGGSTLAQVADAGFCRRSSAQIREACRLISHRRIATGFGIADALPVSPAARGFSRSEDFARSHPAGALGRRLLTRTADIMRTGEALPIIAENATLAEALVPMTSKQMGAVFVCADGGLLRGIFTDGDLRRAIARRGGNNWADVKIAGVMTPSPQSCAPSLLADRALQQMREQSVNQLAITENGKLIGALSFHDLLRHNII